MELQPIFLHREFEPIVQAVSDKLLTKLNEHNDTITAVHYLYGHPLEIVNTLSELDKGGNSVYTKYPLVAFFLDSKMSRKNTTQYGKQRVHLAIINECFDATGNEVAKERDDNNFIPVLSPIYMELMKQISLRGDMFLGMSGENSVLHDVTFRYYWGKNGLWGNEKNIFNDRVDAIEIEDLELTINLNYCPRTI